MAPKPLTIQPVPGPSNKSSTAMLSTNPSQPANPSPSQSTSGKKKRKLDAVAPHNTDEDGPPPSKPKHSLPIPTPDSSSSESDEESSDDGMSLKDHLASMGQKPSSTPTPVTQPTEMETDLELHTPKPKKRASPGKGKEIDLGEESEQEGQHVADIAESPEMGDNESDMDVDEDDNDFDILDDERVTILPSHAARAAQAAQRSGQLDSAWIQPDKQNSLDPSLQPPVHFVDDITKIFGTLPKQEQMDYAKSKRCFLVATYGLYSPYKDSFIKSAVKFLTGDTEGSKVLHLKNLPWIVWQTSTKAQAQKCTEAKSLLNTLRRTVVFFHPFRIVAPSIRILDFHPVLNGQEEALVIALKHYLADARTHKGEQFPVNVEQETYWREPVDNHLRIEIKMGKDSAKNFRKLYHPRLVFSGRSFTIQPPEPCGHCHSDRHSTKNCWWTSEHCETRWGFNPIMKHNDTSSSASTNAGPSRGRGNGARGKGSRGRGRGRGRGKNDAADKEQDA